MRLVPRLAPLLAILSLSPPAASQDTGSPNEVPRHDICADIPETFGMGISSYSDYGPEFIEDTYDSEGVGWNYIYLYVGPTGDRTDEDFFTYVLIPKFEQARDIGAMPVVTFYNLLRLGRDYASPPIDGPEEVVVEAVLKSPGLMREYFEDFAYILQAMDDFGGPFQMHVEPDSWGFMMWAFGIEGNADATSVEVAVESSGFPGLEGFANHAGGFGKALLHLRDTYAPEARMGWHASNFRMNTRPEVVTSFYSSMGKWDLLVGEGGHVNSGDWWDDLDEDAFLEHLNWHKVVTEAAGVPLLSWQRQIGFTDYQFLEATGDLSRVEAYAQNGVIGFEFSLRSSGGDINDSRGQEGNAGDIPPDGHPADGTAGAMRKRLSNYYKSPFALPEGSICYGGKNNLTGGSGTTDPDANMGGNGSISGGDGGTPSQTSGGSVSSGDDDGGGDGDATDSMERDGSSNDSGCACQLGGSARNSSLGIWLLLVLWLVAWRRRGSGSLPPPAPSATLPAPPATCSSME